MKNDSSDNVEAVKPTKGGAAAKRVSSRDVARHAGVSQTTVSFVLSGRKGVTIPDATRERVLRSAAQLGYLPSRLASGLLRGRTQSVGVILMSSVHPWLLFSGIQVELARAGFVPVLLSPSWIGGYSGGSKASVGIVPGEVAHVHRLIEQQVDGLIYYSLDPAHTAECLAELTRRNIPVVLVENDIPEPGVDFVGCDDEAVGRLAARHLLELGRSSFGLGKCAGPSAPATRRSAAFAAELAASGHAYGEFVAEEGMRAEIARELPRLLKPPAAVLACNDVEAAVVLQAARSIGWRVPEDVAILGVGGFQISRYTEPPLSTVVRPLCDVGRKAVELLLERINGYDGPPRRVILPPVLDVRGSTGRTEN